MSDYTQIVYFAPKDALTTGNPAKKIKGTEFDAELSAISVAILSKLDSGDVASNAEAASLVSTSKLITPAALLYAIANGNFTTAPGLITGLPAATPVVGDSLMLYDLSGTALTKCTVQNIIDLVPPSSSFVPSYVCVKHSTFTSLTDNVLTTIPFDTEDTDSDAWHDNVTNNHRLTVPSGVTVANFAASIPLLLSSTQQPYNGYVNIHKNGSADPLVQYPFNDVDVSTASAELTKTVETGPISVTAGDYFEVRVLVNGTTGPFQTLFANSGTSTIQQRFWAVKVA